MASNTMSWGPLSFIFAGWSNTTHLLKDVLADDTAHSVVNGWKDQKQAELSFVGLAVSKATDLRY